MPRWHPSTRVLVAQLAQLAARPGDRGLGDTIERLLAASGIAPYLRGLLAVLMRRLDCGCAQRRDKLNREFPYGRMT